MVRTWQIWTVGVAWLLMDVLSAHAGWKTTANAMREGSTVIFFCLSLSAMALTNRH